MNERYMFSGEAESFEKLELTKEEEAILKGLGLAPEDLHKLLATHPFAEGSYALLFELPNNGDSNLVAKAWKNRKRDSERGAVENVALRLLRIRNFKNAQRASGYLRPSSILFEEKVEGEPVEQLTKDCIERLALALADLHSIKLNAYGKPLTKRKEGTQMDCLLDGIETLHKVAEPFASQAEVMELVNKALYKIKNKAEKSSVAFSSTNFTLVHFDLNKNNILYSKKDGAPIIIDWEQASAGDGAMDIAKLFLKSGFDADQKSDFLKTYESHQVDDQSHFQERLKAYEPFVLINSIIWRLGVLRDMPQQMTSDNESQFYNRVKTNFDKEIKTLKDFVLE